MLKEPFLFVSTYIRSSEGRANREFDKLLAYITSLPSSLKNRVVISGDMNAKIGKKDLAENDIAWIGRNLHHDISNQNGLELKNLLHCLNLKNYLTYSTSKSYEFTWTNGKTTSQLDHVLMSRMDDVRFPEVRCYFHGSVVSDHKVVEVTIKRDNREKRRSATGRQSAQHPTKRLRLNVETLRVDEECRKEYKEQLDDKIVSWSQTETSPDIPVF